jgi:Cerato-platanin
MKLIPFIIPLTAVLVSASSSSSSVGYDPEYDNGAISVDSVTCSGALKAKGYTTFGSLPSFPHIGGAYVVEGSSSPSCGTCYELSYTDKTIYVTAIDSAGQGFNIAQKALEALGGQEAVDAGHISASAKEVDGSNCGF